MRLNNNRLLILSLLAVSLVGTHPGASAGKALSPKQPQSSKEARLRQEETQREIARTKEQIRLNEQQMKEGLSDLNRLTADIQSGRKNVTQLQGKVASLQGEIGTLNTKIAEGEKELARMREEYLKAVKKMRLTKRNQSTLAFIFASEDFNQAMRRIRYLRQFSEWKERQSADINSQISALASEKERLDRARQQESLALAQLETSQRTLESQHRRQEQLIGKLKQNGDMLQGHLRSKQAEANSLKESISRLIAEEQAKEQQAKAEAERTGKELSPKATQKQTGKELSPKVPQEKAAESVGTHPGASDSGKTGKELSQKATKKEEKKKASEKKASEKKQKNSEKSSRRKKGPTQALPAGEGADARGGTLPPAGGAGGGPDLFASCKGSLPRPVDGGWRITNPFGRHSMPEMPEVVYDNPGIDAEVANGASAKAVYAGRVSGVYKVAGYGNVVIVNHGDYYTVYGNLSSVSVSVGTQVTPGQVLGKVGADPDDPRHSSIHFEVWHGRDKQNPAAWIR